MPTAFRIVEKVAELIDWNQPSFLNGMLVTWNAVTRKFEGTFPSVVSSPWGIAPGFDTSLLTSAGLFGYISSNLVLSLTDSSFLSSSLVVGASNVNNGELVVAGIVSSAQFTTLGGLPVSGQKVWLASSTDEVNAAGKLTATPPSSGVLCRVGICLDNSNYTASKVARVLLQIQEPILL